MTNDYGYIIDEVTGEQTFFNKHTGEVVDVVTTTVPIGTIVYTPEQQQQYKERKECESRRAMLRSPRGQQFTFVNAQHQFNDLPPETVGRLMYLATFMQYGSEYFSKTKDTFIKKNELRDILEISYSTFTRFWRDVKDKYLIEDAEGYIQISNPCFWRGIIPKAKNNGDWQKLYNVSLRNLYRRTPNTKHRYLGYIFQMLPFINVEYNILSYNPTESELEYIEPMTIKDFCKVIGYNVEQYARLMKEYSKIVFDVNGQKERFCSFIFDGLNIESAQICINPNILYRGSKRDEVKILGAFCNVS